MAPQGAFIGRRGELSSLERLLGAAQSHGRGRFVAVSGEPGIGKSRLLAELSDRQARSGRLVLDGRATEFEREVPFAVVTDALDDYVASVPSGRLEPLGEERLAQLAPAFPSLARLAHESASFEAERYRTHRAVRALLETLTTSRPLVVVLDDVHWADVATLELLSYLLRRPPRAAMLMAVSFRPAQVATELLSQIDAASSDGDATLVELSTLNQDEIAQLLGEEVGEEGLRHVFEQSGGNPFFAQQLARVPRAGVVTEAEDQPADVPRTVIAAIEQELRGLSERGRLLLQGAAVDGDPFEPERAAVAAEVDEPEALLLLDELLGFDLVRPAQVPTRFRFRHPVVRRAVYESAGPGWRLAAHRRLAAFLRDHGAAAGELAHHVEVAALPGDRDAITVLTQAGHGVADRAPAIAARRYQAALRLLPDNEIPQRLELLVPRAACLASAGDLEAAHAAIEEALSLMPRELGTARVRLVALCAAVEHLMGEHEQAHARLVREYESLTERHSPEAVTLAVELSTDGQWINDYEWMARWGEQALADAQAVGSRTLETPAQVLVALALCCLGRIEDAEHHLSRAVELVDSLDDSELAERLDAVLWLVAAEYLMEQYEDGARHGARGIAVSRATGQGQFLTETKSLWAWCLSALGRLDEASAVIEEALDAARLSRNAQSVAIALMIRQWVTVAVGDVTLALRSGEEGTAIAAGLDQNIAAFLTHAYLGAACLEAGEFERSISEMHLAGAPEFPAFVIERNPFWCEILVRACLGLRRIDAAERWVALAEGFVHQGLPVAAGTARRARAYLLVEQGSFSAAADLAHEAAELQASRGARVEAALSRLLAGRALAASGNREKALAELEHAHSEMEECGARRWRDEASRELRKLGRRVARTGVRGTGVGSLSGREFEVAELVAGGKTNKEIAATLFISEKTVEKHLARTFEKLGVSRRRAVAAHLTQK